MLKVPGGGQGRALSSPPRPAGRPVINATQKGRSSWTEQLVCIPRWPLTRASGGRRWERPYPECAADQHWS